MLSARGERESEALGKKGPGRGHVRAAVRAARLCPFRLV